MSLDLVCGRSGTGKSEYIYNDIKNNLGSEKIFLIVPEQSNLSTEKKLLDVLNQDTLIDVEILTLSRMAYRVLNEVGKNNKTISNIGKNMLIFDILSKEKEELNFLGKNEKNVDVVNRLFTEFKKHQVKTSDLETINIDDKVTKLKLKDITKLYKKYEEKLRNNFIDENDELTLLAENLEKTDIFKNTLIYIDEFLGFTKQEYNIFNKLVKQCKNITIAISTDDLENKLEKEKDIFYFNKKYANNLIEIAKKNNVKINKIYLEKNYRFKNDELRILERSFNETNIKYKVKPENIKIFLASNPYTEIEYIAKNIHNLVKRCGYHYNEIGIIAEDIDNYKEDAKVICNKYEIPIFIDDKKELNQNILIQFIIAMLEIFTNNWSFDSVFNYLKIGLLDIEKEDIYIFENYCRKWGIKNSKFYSREFNYEEINEIQEKLEELRKKIVNPLIEFKRNVSSNRTVTQISKEIYNFLIKNDININLDKKVKSYNSIEISDEYNTSYKLLVQVLDEMTLVFNDETISFEKYKNLLEIGLNACKLGKIPATQDQVILGDTERTRSSKLKCIFVIGINDGNFPKTNRVEGYLNDLDRELLKKSGIELAKNSIEDLYEEQYNIYRTLTTPEEKLFLTYSSSDKEGKSIRPSVLIKKIKRIFPNIEEESDIIQKKFIKTNKKATFEEALELYKDYLGGKEISDEWKNVIRYFYLKDEKRFEKLISGIYYDNSAEVLSEENIQKLYGNYLKTSVSRLESYRRCPFSFHLTYGLKLKEKEKMKLESIDTGSFMHEVIDMFFKELDNNNINIKQIKDEEISEIIDKIVENLLSSTKYYIFSATAKFKLLTKKLKKVIYKSICYIVYSLKNSDFSIFGHEMEFSENGNFKPIKLEIEDKKVEITGKIDRVDIARISDKQYVRIIDYKSSYKDIDLNEVLSGLQIQLITYLDAICTRNKF